LKLIRIILVELFLILILSASTIKNNQTTLTEVASATYVRSEYVGGVLHNMTVAANYINLYFEDHSIKPNSPFSYLEAMNYFMGPEWDNPFGIRGGGACELSTLIYRGALAYDKYGIIKTERDGLGNDHLSGLIFDIEKFDHNKSQWNYPKDKLAVFYGGGEYTWNRDLKVELVRDGHIKYPSNLEIKMHVGKDGEDFVVNVYSNYSSKELLDYIGDK
jgi:hypothetical protein